MPNKDISKILAKRSLDRTKIIYDFYKICVSCDDLSRFEQMLIDLMESDQDILGEDN